MTWVAWRQFRPQAIVGAVVLLLVLGTLAITGPTLSSDYHTYLHALPTCQATGCDGVRSQFLNHFQHLKLLGTALIALPAVVGLFWGAPMVAREFESGAYRLAWTQSVTRTRWIATKLAVVGLASALLAGLYSLAFTWWSAPLDHVNQNRFNPAIFDQRDLAPIGYALFAFALGVAAGVIFRRTLAAMGVTLLGFIAVRMVEQFLVRPHLFSPVRTLFSLSAAGGVGISNSPSGLSLMANPPNVSGAWVTSTKIVNAVGKAPTSSYLAKACPAIANAGPPGSGSGHHAAAGPAAGAFQDCLRTVGASYHVVATYQPASRYWLFQWTELGMFVALAVALAGVSVWWLRHRLS